MSIKVDIEGIDFAKSNVTFVNNLTLEKVKMKYNWLLNAKVKDAIVGEDARGLVWYFGDWYCGEWKDGTWYSGNFYDGVWDNGLWYSYKLDKFDVVNEIFNIKQTGNQYSHFHNGYWLTGTFYGGTFGVNSGETWVDYVLDQTGTYPNYYAPDGAPIFGNQQYKYKKLATWMDGLWVNGEFYDAIWNTGQYRNGLMQNSKWISGNWYNGTFNGHTWHNGNWYNGQFILGSWLDGTFTQLNTSIISRFGNTTLNTTDLSAICTWKNGLWKNGEFFSGYITGSTGEILDSVDNYLSIWENGTWKNGIWYGGHFLNGTWEDGIWKNGIFGYIKTTDWMKPELVQSDFGWSGNTINPTQPGCIGCTIAPENVTASNTANTYYELDYYYQNFNQSSWDTLEPIINITSTANTSFGSTVSFSLKSTSKKSFGYDFYSVEPWDNKTGSEYVNYDLLAMFNNEEYTTNINGVSTGITSIVDLGNNNWSLTTNYVTTKLTGLTFRTKVKSKLESGNGSGQTYWDFNSQIVKNTGVYEVVEMRPYPELEYLIELEYPIPPTPTYYKSFILKCGSVSYIGDNITIVGNSSYNGTYDLRPFSIVNGGPQQHNIITKYAQFDSPGYVQVVTGEIIPGLGEFISGYGITNIPGPSYNTFVAFVGGTKPSFKIGDYIHIEQDLGFKNSKYNGKTIVIETGITSGQYYITTTKKYLENSTSSGKMVKYLPMYSHREWRQMPGITFQNFDFNFGFVENTANTLINGFSVRYGVQILHNRCYTPGFNSTTTYLPMKHLGLYYEQTAINSDGHPIYTIYDKGPNDYDFGWYGNNGIIYRDLKFSDVYKSKNIYDYNNDNNHIITLGGTDDMWGIADLEKYFTQSWADSEYNNTTTGSYNLNTDTISSNYNPKSIITIGTNDRLRISINLQMQGCVSQAIKFSDIEIKAFYSNELDIPVWKKGTWKRGTWYNGDFYDGDFLSGMWIKGNFFGGNMSANYR